jgi:hypothetical protein
MSCVSFILLVEYVYRLQSTQKVSALPIDCAIYVDIESIYRWNIPPLQLTLIPKQSHENLSPFTKDFCVSE